MKNKIFAFILACLTFWIYPALAREVIESFDSLLQVQKDGSIIVTETIVVHHEGKSIRRGIYRDLPTVNGERYELLDVKRNFNAEPNFVEKKPGWYRINTGNNRFLSHPGTSIFEIKYKVWNVPTSFAGYDEVYWNVTGDRWAFPIEKVSARVELPEGAEQIQQASYIGRAGSKNHATYNGDGKFTGRYLNPGEQLTIAVGFTPGIVSTKKEFTFNNALKKYMPVFYLVFLILLYCIWDKKGRDPTHKAIMPQFEAPKELTAAQASYLYNRMPGNLMAISFTQMISNGFLKLIVKKKKVLFSETEIFTLKRTEKEPSNSEEEAIKWHTKILDGEYSPSLQRDANALRKKIKKEMKGYYTTNIFWSLIPTTLMLLLIVVGYFPFFKIPTYVRFPSIVLVSFAACAGYAFLTTALLCRNLFLNLLGFLISSSVMAIPFAILVISQTASLSVDEYITLITWFNLVGITASIFSFLVYQPTEKGQRLTEHLEGLRLFLKTTKKSNEKNILLEEKLNEKNMEDLFPYAMALGLEEEWENKFQNMFGKDSYNHFRHTHPHLSTSFARSFCIKTSSSSGGGGGSGGGGRSGGGFGGGGGGGR